MDVKGYFCVTFISLTTSWIWKGILYLAAIHVLFLLFMHILGVLFCFLLPICKNSLYIIDITLSLHLHYTFFPWSIFLIEFAPDHFILEFISIWKDQSLAKMCREYFN